MRFLKIHTLLVLLLFLPSAVFAEDFMDQALGMEYLKEGLHRYNRQEYEAAIDFFRKSLGRIPVSYTHLTLPTN